MAAGAGALSFFADEEDARILLDWLNADPEIAFIVADGPRAPPIAPQHPPSGQDGGKATAYVSVGCPDTGHRQRWRAVRGAQSLEDGRRSLWYVPAGPLPLLKAAPKAPHPRIPDPWAGWTEERPGLDCDTPYFGPAHPAEIRITLWTRHRPYTPAERATLRKIISYWILGYDLLVASEFQWGGGNAQAQRWWSRLEAWMSRAAVPLASSQDSREVFWAFPSALKKLKAGMRYEARGWDLDSAIRRAAVHPPKSAK